jgi:uncharacterized membrane protein
LRLKDHVCHAARALAFAEDFAQSVDPIARRNGVSGWAVAAATAASSVTTLASPLAKRFWRVPQARSAAAWLGAATTVS